MLQHADARRRRPVQRIGPSVAVVPFLDRALRKEAVQRQKEQLTAAFEAGKAAYREEKGLPNE